MVYFYTNLDKYVKTIKRKKKKQAALPASHLAVLILYNNFSEKITIK